MSPIRCLIFAAFLTTTCVLARKMVNPAIGLQRCKKCALAYRCSPYYSDQLAWALVDGVCEVFANGCMMGSYNCGRINECKPEIVTSNQKECQQNCASNCENSTQEPHYGWVYALSTDGSSAGSEYCQDFASKCAALQWACETATPLSNVSPGTCALYGK